MFYGLERASGGEIGKYLYAYHLEKILEGDYDSGWLVRYRDEVVWDSGVMDI